MPTFLAPDGTELAYHVSGSGAAVICLPGGMQASAYLGDLGGLAAHADRQLVLLDLRGTGDSGRPADPATYRCDRQVGDVEALREHLGRDRVDLLAHSGGANLAVGYAAAYPDRIGTLALITPSTRAVGIEVQPEARRRLLAQRKDEPWYPTAAAAFEEIAAGRGTSADWEAVAPMAYGRWDAAAQAHDAARAEQTNDEAFQVFNSDGAFDPAATRASLAKLDAPVLLLAGELDWSTDPVTAEEFAGLFPNAQLAVQPGAGHFPWLYDATTFVATVTRFWAEPSRKPGE